jgi:hypothetical protein
MLRYTAERVTRFVDAQLHKLAEAQRDPEDADQYTRPLAIILPGKEAKQEGGPKLVSTGTFNLPVLIYGPILTDGLCKQTVG